MIFTIVVDGFISIADANAQPSFARKTKCCEEGLLVWQLLCDHLERLLNIGLKPAAFRTATSAKTDPLSDETSRSPYSLHMYGSPFCLTKTPALASVPARVPARVPAPRASFGCRREEHLTMQIPGIKAELDW